MLLQTNKHMSEEPSAPSRSSEKLLVPQYPYQTLRAHRIHGRASMRNTIIPTTTMAQHHCLTKTQHALQLSHNLRRCRDAAPRRVYKGRALRSELKIMIQHNKLLFHNQVAGNFTSNTFTTHYNYLRQYEVRSRHPRPHGLHSRFAHQAPGYLHYRRTQLGQRRR